jgi:hypothetical protein
MVNDYELKIKNKKERNQKTSSFHFRSLSSISLPNFKQPERGGADFQKEEGKCLVQ